MRVTFASLVLACSAAIAVPASAATVLGNDSGLTDLGVFAPGAYNIAGTGIVSLIGAVGTGFDMRPDGIPNSPVTYASYLYFNPSGSTIADGVPGNVGAGALIGGLYGTLTAAPASPADYFMIGYGTTQSLGVGGHIYARVNDTFHENNSGSFDVTVTPVPEPHEWAMMLAGLGLVGWVARRRSSTLGVPA